MTDVKVTCSCAFAQSPFFLFPSYFSKLSYALSKKHAAKPIISCKPSVIHELLWAGNKGWRGSLRGRPREERTLS
jgi:hypothetical protein